MATKSTGRGSSTRSVSKTTAKKASTKAPSKKTTKASPTKIAAEKTTAAKKPSSTKKRSGSGAAKKSGSSRRYPPDASKNVEREMKEMHEGKLTIGRSGKKVTNPKQAIAIGLSEARRAGKKVPPNPNR